MGQIHRSYLERVIREDSERLVWNCKAFIDSYVLIVSQSSNALTSDTSHDFRLTTTADGTVIGQTKLGIT